MEEVKIIIEQEDKKSTFNLSWDGETFEIKIDFGDAGISPNDDSLFAQINAIVMKALR